MQQEPDQEEKIYALKGKKFLDCVLKNNAESFVYALRGLHDLICTLDYSV